MANIESLRAIYRTKTNGEPSRFHIWEKGDAAGDSVTPATYSGAYRIWMRDLLRKFLDDSGSEAPGLISVGCGNASVEAGLVTMGYPVIGVDAMEEAVQFARSKGVDAVCTDFFTWTPPPGHDWRVVYADGLLGHVFDPVDGLRPAFEQMRTWLPEGSGILVISNDDTRTDSAPTEAHSEVPGFTWLSGPYLKAQAEAAGFKDIWSTWFTYVRPVSGPCERVIVTAQY